MTTVLVVDDDPAIQRTLAIGLRARGYDVLPARDGRTAVEAVHEDDPWTTDARAAVDSEIEDLAQWLELDLVRP